MPTQAEARPFRTPQPPPAIPGLVVRHFAGPSDFAGMNDAANDSRVADGEDFVTDLEAFATFYSHLTNCDLANDVLIVEVDGTIVGYGRTAWHVEQGDVRVHELVCLLRGDWRRRAIGRTMLAALEARAIDVGAGLPPSADAVLEVFGSEGDGGHEALVRSFGFEPVRYGFQMIRPDLDDQPDAPMPAGLEIRDVRDEDLRRIWEASDEAFRDGNGYRPSTEDDYLQFLDDPNGRDRSLWRIAWDGDEVAGQVRGFIDESTNARLGTARGFVENISVRRPWRHRGLARALINETFKVLRGRGMTEGALSVDATNPTGALRVYESMGFRPVNRSTTYQKRIGGAGPA